MILYIFKPFSFFFHDPLGLLGYDEQRRIKILPGNLFTNGPRKIWWPPAHIFFQVWLSDFKFRYLLIRPTSASDVSSSSILKYINYFSIVKKFTFKVIIKCQKNTKIGPPRKCFKNFCARSKNCMYKNFSNRTFIINFI